MPHRDAAGTRYWLDAEVVFDRSLVGDGVLDLLQEVLVESAPQWSSELRVWRGPHDQRTISSGQTGALAAAVCEASTERGATYKVLVEHYGKPPYERMLGSAELRGSSRELTVVISIDEWVMAPLGAKKIFGNSIELQVRRSKVEGRACKDWIWTVFNALCEQLSPAWGSVRAPDEYWAKVMSEQPRIEAVGRDFGRYLPGLFWLNFFGDRYRSLIGENSLLSAPASLTEPVGDGILIALDSDPTRWDSPGYIEMEKQVRQHLGAHFFFSKSENDR